MFVYGYESSQQYVIDAGAVCTDDPANAEVIVMAASLLAKIILLIAMFFSTATKSTTPVICINPDHYVRYANGFLSVMGFYAE